MSFDPALFDRVHDGVASPAERAAFESARTLSAELAAELDLQAAIDTRLCALFAPRAASGVIVPLRASHTRRRWAVLAVALAAAALALYAGWRWRTGDPALRAPDGRSWSELYAACDAQYAPPGVVACTSDEPLPNVLQRTFGASLALEPGWVAIPARESAESAPCTSGAPLVYWLVGPDGRRALVFFDAVARAKPIAVTRDGELESAARELGPLHCTALAREGAERALDALVLVRSDTR